MEKRQVSIVKRISKNTRVRTVNVEYESEVSAIDKILNAKSVDESTIDSILEYLDELETDDKLHVLHHILKQPNNSVTVEFVVELGSHYEDDEFIENKSESLLRRCRTRDIPEYSECPNCKQKTLTIKMISTRSNDEPISTIEYCVGCGYGEKE